MKKINEKIFEEIGIASGKALQAIQGAKQITTDRAQKLTLAAKADIAEQMLLGLPVLCECGCGKIVGRGEPLVKTPEEYLALLKT